MQASAASNVDIILSVPGQDTVTIDCGSVAVDQYSSCIATISGSLFSTGEDVDATLYVARRIARHSTPGNPRHLLTELSASGLYFPTVMLSFETRDVDRQRNMWSCAVALARSTLSTVICSCGWTCQHNPSWRHNHFTDSFTPVWQPAKSSCSVHNGHWCDTYRCSHGMIWLGRYLCNWQVDLIVPEELDVSLGTTSDSNLVTVLTDITSTQQVPAGFKRYSGVGCVCLPSVRCWLPRCWLIFCFTHTASCHNHSYGSNPHLLDSSATATELFRVRLVPPLVGDGEQSPALFNITAETIKVRRPFAQLGALRPAAMSNHVRVVCRIRRLLSVTVTAVVKSPLRRR